MADSSKRLEACSSFCVDEADFFVSRLATMFFRLDAMFQNILPGLIPPDFFLLPASVSLSFAEVLLVA